MQVFFSLPSHWWSERLFSCFIGNVKGLKPYFSFCILIREVE